MPSTITHNPAETERKEPGFGGKPPSTFGLPAVAEEGATTRGKNQGRGPRELLHKVRFFVYSALAADMLFFAVLVLFFFARHAGLRMDPRSHLLTGDWQPLLLPPILYLNTAVLLLSSLTMERARLNIFRESGRAGGMAGTGPAGATADPALGGCDAGAGSFVSCGAGIWPGRN